MRSLSRRVHTSALWNTFRLGIQVRREQGFDVVHACNPPDLLFLIGGFFKIFARTKFLSIITTSTQSCTKPKFGRRDFLLAEVMVWLERVVSHRRRVDSH